MFSIRASVFVFAIAAVFSVTTAQAQSLVPACERLSIYKDPTTSGLQISFVLIAHDVTSRTPVRCRIPLQSLESYSISDIGMTLYWERSPKSYPFVVRILNARTGEELQGQTSYVGLYSTINHDYSDLALGTSDDLIIEVRNKSGKAQYVGLSGIALGGPN